MVLHFAGAPTGILSDVSSSPLLLSVVTIAVVFFWTKPWRKHYNQLKRVGNFRQSSPWYFPIDIIRIIRAGSIRQFIVNRKQILKVDIFSIYIAGISKYTTLVITKPEDQVEFMGKGGKMKLILDLPDTVVQAHGPGNLQSISGEKHQSMRKILSSLLSPTALESFVPSILACFDKMWTNLEEQAQETSDKIKIQDVIRSEQFYLMSNILYGLKPETPDLKADLAVLRKDFELQLDSLFARPGSDKARKGLAASKRNRKHLSNRFSTVLDNRRKLFDSCSTDQEKMPALESIGNAMEAIADALLHESIDRDPQVLSDVYDNLNFLLEASHSTTMLTTTTTMFFLNHPKNSDKLIKLRNEIKRFKERPSYGALKGEMPYAEGCIKEAMRLAPSVGGLGYVMEEGQEVVFKGNRISGPVSFLLYFSQNYKDPSLFIEPNKFIPERWIIGSDMEVSDRARMAYKPFSGGRHMCLGYQLALLVMKASLYCFASNEKRIIEYDTDSVKIVNDNIFPEFYVSDGLPGRVIIREVTNIAASGHAYM